MRFNICLNCHFYTKLLILMILQTKTTKNTHKKWPYIPDHPYRILIIGGSGSGKTNALLNLINEQDDIEKNLLGWKRFKRTKV